MDYTPAQLEEKLEKYCVEVAQKGPEYAEKQGLFFSVDQRKNDYLAKLTKESEGSSNAEKERNARCSTAWEDFRNDLVQMEKEALVAKIAYEISKTKWETAKSLLYSKNQERRTNT